MTKSAALEQFAAWLNSNAKLSSLELAQSGIKTLEQAGNTLLAVRDKDPRLSLSKVSLSSENKDNLKRPTLRIKWWKESEKLTFCGDLDVETGDWDLMVLAEEPADKHMRKRDRGNSNQSVFYFQSRNMTQHESCKHKHMELRGPVA